MRVYIVVIGSRALAGVYRAHSAARRLRDEIMGCVDGTVDIVALERAPEPPGPRRAWQGWDMCLARGWERAEAGRWGRCG